MSVYNGEKFIRHQLDSVLGQENVSIHLLIRDDGSIDSTIKIIEQYQSLYPHVIDLITGNNIGWKQSFFKLMQVAAEKYPVYDYYAFCDQDDIWMSQKISVALEILNTIPTPIKLYCSNLYYYKDGISHGLIHSHRPKPTIKNCLITNQATGCSTVFSKGLLNIITSNEPSQPLPHDYLAYQLSLLSGGYVYVDNNSYILYRQHESNQIGGSKKRIDLWKRRIKTFKQTWRLREKTAKIILDTYSHLLPFESVKELQYLTLYRFSITKRIHLLNDSSRLTGKPFNDMWLRLRILAGGL